jgi:hypothetical protein
MAQAAAAMMNTGWRTITLVGRPCSVVLPWPGSVGKGMHDITARLSAPTPISATYAPANGWLSTSRLQLARLGPTTPPRMPPASTQLMARSLNSGLTSSTDANLDSDPLAL